MWQVEWDNAMPVSDNGNMSTSQLVKQVATGKTVARILLVPGNQLEEDAHYEVQLFDPNGQIVQQYDPEKDANVSCLFHPNDWQDLIAFVEGYFHEVWDV